MNNTILFERGKQLYAVNRFRHAIEEYLKIPDDSPLAAVAYEQIGLCYSCLNENENAVEFVKKALEKQPNEFSALWLMGEVLLSMKSPDTAIPYLLQAIEIKPDEPTLLGALGKAYGRTGDFAKGLHIVDDALKIDPICATALITKMEIYARVSQEADFILAAQKALAAAPNDEHAHGIYAWGNLQFGNLALAKKHYKIVLQINPNAKFASDVLSKLEREENTEINKKTDDEWFDSSRPTIILLLMVIGIIVLLVSHKTCKPKPQWPMQTNYILKYTILIGIIFIPLFDSI